MQEDRGLWLVLGGVFALAVLAVVVYLLRPAPTYGDDSTPEGVVRNYLIAIVQGDFDRAYGYLDERVRPARDRFTADLFNSRQERQDITVRLGATTRNGDQAFVEVSIRHAGHGPFDTGWQYSDVFHLTRSADGWRIRSGPYPFFSWEPPERLPVPGD